MREATRGQVCAINHDPDPLRRDATLEAWVAEEFPSGHEARWFELTAAASTDLTIFALLALASEPTCTDDQIAQTSRSLLSRGRRLSTAMFDSYVDQARGHRQRRSQLHGSLSRRLDLATSGICLFMRRCLRETGSLDNGEKHDPDRGLHVRHVPVQEQRADPTDAV